MTTSPALYRRVRLLVVFLTAIVSGPGSAVFVSSGWSSDRPAARLPPGLQLALNEARARENRTAYGAHARPSEPSAYRVENPAQRFDAHFTRHGVRVSRRGADDAAGIVLRAASLSVGDANSPLAPGAWHQDGIRVARELVGRGALRVTEWYVNAPVGLEQGFTIGDWGSGIGDQGGGDQADALRLTIAVDGATARRAGQSVLLTDASGVRLSYGGIDAWDARGTRLPARIEPIDGVLHLIVATAGAEYPVTVDPLLQQAQLTASDGAPSDQFGFSVAIDGDTALVGSVVDNVGANADQGSVYVFTRSDAVWTQQQQLTASDGAAGDQFGRSVALSGGTAVVGASFHDVGANADQGAAYVFTRSGTVWSQQQKLTASDGAGGDQFGFTVALSGDTVVVGAQFHDVGANADQGSAYVFTRSGSVWSQQQQLTAGDGSANDRLGNSVAIDGNTTLAGAFADNISGVVNQGSAYVFTRSGTVWTQQQRLTASDGATGDQFGFWVALHGDTALVGALFDDVGAIADQGSAYVFTRSGTVWSQQQQLTAGDGAASDRFGRSVALSGDTAVVGAFLHDVGANADQGSAYVFTRSGTVWSQQQALTASDGAASDQFGFSVALSGDTVLVGANLDDVAAASNQGSAYVFAPAPTLTVTKVVSPAADPGTFNLQIDGATAGTGANVGNNGTTGAITVTSGAHTVGETAGTDTSLADYIRVFGGACDSGGAVTTLAGQNKACTITNSRKARLTVNKVTVPSNDAGKFNLQIDGATAGTGANVGNGGTTGSITLGTLGTHTVGETAGTSTSLTDYDTVISGDCAANGSIVVTAGDVKTCTITNTRRPTLTVTKVVVPSSDSGSFNLRIDGATAGTGANVGHGGTTGAVSVSAGAHTVSETAGTSTTLADYITTFSGDCASDGTITLVTGDNKTCTITNTRKPRLTITKSLAPTSDPGKFNLLIDGNAFATDVGHGGSTTVTLNAVGTYTVSESAGTGTSLTNYLSSIGGACASNGSVTLAAGDNKTCTITNSRKPRLTVTKALAPSSDPGVFNLLIDGVAFATNVGDTGTTGAVQLDTFGSHTVSETAGTSTNLINYLTSIGGDCAANGTISLAAGDVKTCTITNSRKPRLTVTKVLAPASDPGRFTLRIDGVAFATDVGDGGTTGPVQLDSFGVHTATEIAGTGTSLVNYITAIGGDCAANGTITLAAGDVKTCTITNSRKPRLTVTKTLIPANDLGRFNLQIDGATAGTGANVGNGGTTGIVQLDTLGAHTVGETAAAGSFLIDFTTVIGGNCAADGSITLAAGDVKTCTITNTRKVQFNGVVTATPPSLFPADRRMFRVTASATITGPHTPPVTCAIQSVTQNTPVQGTGPDSVLVPPLAVDLRAERPVGGIAREYTLNVRCTDQTGAGNNGTVVVPVRGIR